MDLELRPLNVLIGANGAGKSNLISFFKMLNEMMGGRLQNYVAAAGHAHSLLYFGPKRTPQIEATLELETDAGTNTYCHRLFFVADDGQHTAPSKRIIAKIADYGDAKAVVGPQVAELIGLNVIRGKCPHFADWLTRLEALGGLSTDRFQRDD